MNACRVSAHRCLLPTWVHFHTDRWHAAFKERALLVFLCFCASQWQQAERFIITWTSLIPLWMLFHVDFKSSCMCWAHVCRTSAVKGSLRLTWSRGSASLSSAQTRVPNRHKMSAPYWDTGGSTFPRWKPFSFTVYGWAQWNLCFLLFLFFSPKLYNLRKAY